MKLNFWHILMSGVLIVMMSVLHLQRINFQISKRSRSSVATPGLSVVPKFSMLISARCAITSILFPLPVGKAEKKSNDEVGNHYVQRWCGEINVWWSGTSVQRLSSNGNVIVVHNNGLETVYADNAQNMVDVGQRVKAGQTIASVGGSNGRAYCTFPSWSTVAESIRGYHSRFEETQTAQTGAVVRKQEFVCGCLCHFCGYGG